MDMTEVAWAAGFFDGEGSVGWYWHGPRKHWTLRVSLGNTHVPSVERFAALVGVGTLHKKPSFGLPIYMWVATDRAAETALRLLLPHLFTKREQADLALEARSLGQARPGVAITAENNERRSLIAAELATLKRKPYYLEA